MQALHRVIASEALRRLALLALCAAYLQGGWNKIGDFGSAVAEMQHFGLAPARRSRRWSSRSNSAPR